MFLRQRTEEGARVLLCIDVRLRKCKLYTSQNTSRMYRIKVLGICLGK